MSLITRYLVWLVLLAACQDAQEPPVAPASTVKLEFELIDETGSPVTESDFDTRLRLVFFGFTSCPDICPITLQNVATALRSIGGAASDVTVLFVSIDPHRDTPERLALYTDAYHPSAVGLTGSWDQLTTVTDLLRTTFGHSVTDESGRERPLGQAEYESMPEGARYSPFHSSQLYVVGEDGRLLDVIGYGSPPAQIEAVLRGYLN